MRLVGWCSGCKKVRYVSLTNNALASLELLGGFPTGTCVDCERDSRLADETAARDDLLRRHTQSRKESST